VNATVVAVTGGVDRITDGARHAVIANGDPLMGQVTAMGCAGSALVAAVLAVETDPFIAARAALTAFGVAGEVAALDSEGPGSFAAAILDALYGLDRATLRQRARVS
jgi:hydroxyethylthiazole kinase